MASGGIGEFELIARVFAPLAADGALGLTDDAAFYRPRPGRDLVLDHDRRKNREPYVLAGEKPHHGHVLYLGHDLRLDAQMVRKGVEAGTNTAVDHRQDDRMPYQ